MLALLDPDGATLVRRISGLSQRHYALLALIYALLVVYSSLVIGPLGVHFVAMDPAAAWREFLATPFVDHDSNERPDWIANLIMLAPFGYLAAGMLRPRPGPLWMAGAVVAGWLVSALFILSVKYAQLFFPPRTVTVNYIVAQSIGATLGVLLFWVSHTRLFPVIERRFERGQGLVVILGVYSAVLGLYFLAPFDFVLSASDLESRLRALPALLSPPPGAEPSRLLRAAMAIGKIASTVPVGMLLAITGRGYSLGRLALNGFGLMVAVAILSLFVLSVTPAPTAILYRTAGIVAGILLMRWVGGKDLRRRLYRLSRLMPAIILVYVASVLYLTGLIDSHWRTGDEAMRALDERGLLPFWHYYIVSKASAAKSIALHAAVFAPIGAMVWLRRGGWSSGPAFSAVLAFALSFVTEIGRWMKPGLQPDFSDPIVAAVAASCACKLAPILWRMLEREAALFTWAPARPPTRG
jgi:VanZ family protein